MDEHVAHCMQGRWRPLHTPLAQSLGQAHSILQQGDGDLTDRAELREAAEHLGHRGAHRFVGAHDDRSVGPVVIPDRQPEVQLALGRFVADPGDEPSPQHVELGLRDGPLKTEHEPVGVVGGVVDAVGVGDERLGQRTEVE